MPAPRATPKCWVEYWSRSCSSNISGVALLSAKRARYWFSSNLPVTESKKPGAWRICRRTSSLPGRMPVCQAQFRKPSCWDFCCRYWTRPPWPISSSKVSARPACSWDCWRIRSISDRNSAWLRLRSPALTTCLGPILPRMSSWVPPVTSSPIAQTTSSPMAHFDLAKVRNAVSMVGPGGSAARVSLGL